MPTDFKIDFLDHVALRVKDLEVSAQWYERVLGLKRYQFKEWGDFPIFMMANKCGVALFPAQGEAPSSPILRRGTGIDHFAFNVSRDNFDKAKRKYATLDLDHEVQDHHYFESLYTKDPDGHTVELTTIVVSTEEFYR